MWNGLSRRHHILYLVGSSDKVTGPMLMVVVFDLLNINMYVFLKPVFSKTDRISCLRC